MKYTAHFILLFLVILFSPASYAQEPTAPIAGLDDEDELQLAVTADDRWTNLIYFTGIGCPHCANTDPVILNSRLRKGDVMVFEYEIYKDKVNLHMLEEYQEAYGARASVPQIIAGPNKKTSIVSGDAPVLKGLNKIIRSHKGNDVLLGNSAISFNKLSFIKLPYKPKIWFKNRMASREDSSSLQDELIKEFLLNGNLPEECLPQKNADAPISSGTITFHNACSYDGWVLMYDSE